MKFTVRLDPPAHEMACEEIDKQLAFLGGDIRISPGGDTIEFDAPPDTGPELLVRVETLARKIERVLRNVPRKIVFRSAAADHARFADPVDLSGILLLGPGWVAIQGIPLRLFRYFDRMFESMGSRWSTETLAAPSLISSQVLDQAGYSNSFPQHVTFASHSKGDTGICLSPAVCYHVYGLNQGRAVPVTGAAYNICGKCYRHEPSGTADLRRLWEFAMREWVFLGTSAWVLAHRNESIQMMSEFLDAHKLAGEIRTASDPFFLSPDAVAKTYYQLKSDSKFEVSLFLSRGERLAVGSFNYHADFFGRAFDVPLESGGPMHSACVAFGLERWVYAFLAQHGSRPEWWPEAVRNAPEFRGLY